MICHATFLVLFILLGQSVLWRFNILSVLVFVLALVLARRGRLNLAMLLASIEVMAHQYLAVIHIGWSASFQLYLFLISMLWCLFTSVSRLSRAVLVVLPIAVYLALYGVYGTAGAPAPLSATSAAVLDGLTTLNIVAFSIILIGICGYYIHAVTSARERVESQTTELAGLSLRLGSLLEEEQELSAKLDRESRGRIESQQYFLEHLARVAGLSRLSELCAQQSSEEALIRNSCEMAGRITGADQVELLLVDEARPGMQRLVLHGLQEEHSLHGGQLEGNWQWVPVAAMPWLDTAREKGSLVVNDSATEAGHWADALRVGRFGSGVVMPVLAGGTNIGVLTAGTRFKGHFDKPAQNTVRQFAGTIGANLGLIRAMRALETNLDEADSVLTSVLPVAVTSRLKGGESNIADRILMAGVFFCDLAGFTAYSSETEPEEVVAMLQETFSLLEQACVKHETEKIKTIGDAFMAVSGVSTKVDDPIETIASFALEAAEVLRVHLAEKDLGLDFRIGIHAGSVLAGILGSDRLFFDIWGDTVNLASRLESAAAFGDINCSDTIRNGLGDDWNFADRGILELKGKGKQQVWALLGRAPAAGSIEAGE